MKKSFAEVKELIKERADLASRVARDTKLFKTGNGFKACCPLPGHSEKSPSFHVNTRDNYYYCFGCQRGGDIFSYLEQTQGLSFFDALKELAEEYQIPLPQMGERVANTKSERDEALSVLERACKYYEENFHKGTGPLSEKARAYLESRGYDLDFAKELRIGWAPESGNRIAAKLRENNFLKIGEDVGLLVKGKNSDDFFKARLMIPIEDHRGRVVAFSGRLLQHPLPSGVPKYKNSPESIVFKKKELLYGLFRAQKRARELGWVCIVEGFFDAWALERRSIPTVAVMGVALTAEHLMRLENTCKQVVLVMDTDRAGIESTKRSLPLLYSKGFEVKVFAALDGKDPDEWLKTTGLNGTELERVLQKAPEGMEWWGLQLLQEGREKGLNPLQIIHRLEELWPFLTSPMHKRLWIQSMALNLGLQEEQLAAHFKQVGNNLPVVQDAELNHSAAAFEHDPLTTTQLPREVSSPELFIQADLLALFFKHPLVFKDLKSMPEAALIRESFMGEVLGDVLSKELEEPEFDPKRLKVTLFEKGLGALLARALVSDEAEASEGGALGGGRDPKRSLMDLCIQFQSIKKQLQLKKLTLELKMCREEQKTAQLLHAIHTLRVEVESLKKFSFSE